MTEEVSEECLAAMRATADVLEERCKLTPMHFIDIDSVRIDVPDYVLGSLNGEYHNLSDEEKVNRMVEDSDWLKRWSTNWLERVIPESVMPPGSEAFENARLKLARDTAETMVAKFVE